MRALLLPAALLALAPLVLAAGLPLPETLVNVGNHVDIANVAYDPSILVVPLGTTVTWQNHDAVTHTATENGGAWDTGAILGGRSASVTLAAPGVYQYHCAIHQAMKGILVVVS